MSDDHGGDHCRDKRPRQPPLVRIASHAIHQLDSADRQEPSLARTTKTTRLNEKIAKLKVEMQRLEALDVRMLATPDQQISLTDPDARSMATSGRGSGVGTDRSQLASVAKQTKDTLETESLDVVADRGYFNSAEILACEEAGITVTDDNLERKGGGAFRNAGLPLRG